ncbi:hypothetical protein [Streptacidiphilus sp. MAP12-33]|uniref:hypothetical protein n=1 Tax=Streptacidiphilus sp. MAP12-33 TaxID=3156266 RepID=UPI00351185D8
MALPRPPAAGSRWLGARAPVNANPQEPPPVYQTCDGRDRAAYGGPTSLGTTNGLTALAT